MRKEKTVIWPGMASLHVVNADVVLGEMAGALAEEYRDWKTFESDDCGGKKGSCNGHPIPIAVRIGEARRIIERLAKRGYRIGTEEPDAATE